MGMEEGDDSASCMNLLRTVKFSGHGVVVVF